MFRFLETDIREQQKYEKRIQTSLDNSVNNMCHEIKFDTRMEGKNTFLLSKTFLFFFKQKYIFLFLEKFFFFRFLLIQLPRYFFAKEDT